MYLPSLISVPFVRSIILPGQVNSIEKKWLRGDNSVNIQDMSMLLLHWTSCLCHLSINQVSFQSKIWPGQATVMKNG